MNNFTQFEQKIKDFNNNKNVGILLMREETLQQIADNSGPLAQYNEFQVHYWALVERTTYADNSIVDLAFPTVFFNYTQQVNSIHIDFELKDVQEMSDALKPLHDQIAQNILEELGNKPSTEEYTVEYLSVPMNTLHRHPTGVSSFSGTDLAKNHITETGVVFPLAEANKTPSFSSIMYNNPVKLVRTEYRIATGSITTTGVNYEKGRSATLYIPKPVKLSIAESVFIAEESTNKNLTTVSNGIINIPENIINYVLKAVSMPNTSFIKAENVTSKRIELPTLDVTKHTSMSFWEDIKPIKGNEINKYSIYTFDAYLLEDSETISSLEEKYNLNFKTDEELSKCSKEELIESLNKFSKVYYGNALKKQEIEEYKTETIENLAEEVSEIQYLFYDENTTKEIDYDIQRVFNS